MSVPIVFRMDDVGASTKEFNVYSNYRFGNFLFLKKIWPFKAWAPYKEINYKIWEEIFNFLYKYNFKMTLAVTASWVDGNNNKIPFPEKFPNESEIIKKAYNQNLIEIVNHGWTHCVVGEHLPRRFSSVRKYHREFWDWIPFEIQYSHLKNAEKILHNWLGDKVKIFVPPGNVYSIQTLNALDAIGFQAINTSVIIKNNVNKIKMIDNTNVFSFHDRDVVVEGVKWLKEKILLYKNDNRSSFLKELI